MLFFLNSKLYDRKLGFNTLLRPIGVLGKKFFARELPESFLKVGIFFGNECFSIEKVFTFMQAHDAGYL